MLRGEVYKPGTHQSVGYTDSAAAISNAVGSQTYLIRVVVTTAAYVKIGNDPTATDADIYLKADTPEIFVCTPGMKVSAIRVADNGTLHVTELS